MPLQKSNAVFPLAKGIDTKTDPKQLVAGTMLSLENVVLTSPGQFQKRNGYEELAAISNPHGLGVLNDELVAFGDNSVYSYSPGEERFVPVKQYISNPPETESFQGMQASSFPAIATPGNFILSDTAYHSSGLQAFVGVQQTFSTYNSYFTIVDSNSKAVLYSGRFSTGARTAAKVFSLGGYFIVLFYSSSTIKYIPIPVSTTSGAMPSSVTIATTMAAANGQTYDAVVFNNVLYIVWGLTGNGFGYATIDLSLTARAGTYITTDTISKAISITSDSTTGNLSVSYYNGSAVVYLQVSIVFLQVLAPVVVDTIAGVITIAQIISNNSGYLYYEIAGSGAGTGRYFNNLIKRSAISGGVPGTSAVWVRSVGIVSKPFQVTLDGTVITCIMGGYTGAQPAAPSGTIFIFNTSGVVIGKLAPGNCVGIGNWALSTSNLQSSVTEVCQISSTKFTSAFLQANYIFSFDAFDTSTGDTNSQYGVFASVFDFDSTINYQTAVAGNNLHFTGGILSMYDGQNLVEHGYHIIAEAPTSSAQTHAGDDNFPAGTYSYQIVYEWMDAKGSYHRSVPSAPYAVTVSSSQTQIALTIPTLRLTQKNMVFLSVFRNTLANPTIFNRVLTVPDASQQNSTTANSITFNDIYPDSTISAQQFIYTLGGVVPNYSVPCPKIVSEYRNRLVVVPNETPNIIWISKNVLQGIPPSPVEFSAFLTIQVNTLGGDIIGFAQLDEKGIVFKRRNIFYFVGDGPSDTGANNDISIPQLIPSDVGCVSQRSIVLTPNGLLFKSEKGIYLLDRSLQVSYIGAPVEAYNDNDIVSSKLIPNTTQVRFLLDDGIVLVYDYFVQQWCVFTNHSGVDAVIHNSLYTYINDSGVALQETPGEYSDNGSFIQMKLQTGWLSFAGIQGFQRVWKMEMLGEYESPHAVIVSLAYDFNPNTFQTVQFDVDDIFGDLVYGESTPYGADEVYGGTYPLEQFTIYPTIQRCEALQVTIQDVYTSEIGNSFNLSSLGFEVGVEGGLNRQPATNKLG